MPSCCRLPWTPSPDWNPSQPQSTTSDSTHLLPYLWIVYQLHLAKRPVEGHLRSARKTHTANDWHQRRIHLPGHDLAGQMKVWPSLWFCALQSPKCRYLTQEGKVQEGGHDWLGGFHNVSEGHGTSKEGNHLRHRGGPHSEDMVAAKARTAPTCVAKWPSLRM